MPHFAALPSPPLPWALPAAIALYALAAAVALFRPRLGRPVAALAVLVHLAAMVGRGLAIGDFPLTSKLESFSAASLALGLVTLASWRRDRVYVVPLLAVTAGALAAALSFGQQLRYPVPPLRTVWYPLHVPLSFVAYGMWTAAAAAAVTWARRREAAWLRHTERLALQGFGLWSVSMVFGGIWGVVAWGAYFMWDPKVLWSVILWFHYASLVHVRYTPELRSRPWLAPALAVVGFILVMVAYVGTSFFFGRSSHAF